MRKLRVLPFALALALGLPAAAAADEAAPEAAGRPRMEVAFVLDTTGSMGGLIETAKRKIWAIANELTRAKPAPEIRVGLVAYRDRGDEFVTRVFDLSTDLDRVYTDLCSFQAGGGGDGPESVNQALRDAVAKLSWTPGEKVMKVLFLVGDAPPHMDYDQDVPYARTCEEAARAGIVLNTLRCGGDPQTEKVWAEIARLAEGVYASIPQEGSETPPTPFDGRIAELGRGLAGTMLAWGDAAVREDAARKLKDSEGFALAAGAPEAKDAVAAERAVLLAKADRLDEADLVAAVAGGRLRLEEVGADKLPEEMRKLTPEERKALVEGKIRERETLKKELGALEAKRAAFLAEALKKAAAAGRSAFDLEVGKTLRAQAERKGFRFE